MQIFSGSGERSVIIEEIEAKYPECRPENMHGKIQTAGHTTFFFYK